jgi:mono/diheme cytochrome c family protein
MKTMTLLIGTATLLLLYGCSKTEDAPPQYGTIGDYTWTDANANGQQDTGEQPLAGVKVVLYDGTGTRKIDSTTTSATGLYLYDKLTTGTYKLRFGIPTGTVATTGNIGTDASDSDINALGWTHPISIDVSKAATDTLRINKQVDAGFRAQVSYATDVNPILTASCQPCHVVGGGASFDSRVKHVNNYDIAKGISAAMLDRVSRAQGASGMMPRNGTRLSEEKIALIKKWIDDGLAK